MFKLIDDIVAIGKAIYHEIPEGRCCNKCPLLCKDTIYGYTSLYCLLRRSIGLIHDSKDGHVFKMDGCPKSKIEEEG